MIIFRIILSRNWFSPKLKILVWIGWKCSILFSPLLLNTISILKRIVLHTFWAPELSIVYRVNCLYLRLCYDTKLYTEIEKKRFCKLQFEEIARFEWKNWKNGWFANQLWFKILAHFNIFYWKTARLANFGNSPPKTTFSSELSWFFISICKGFLRFVKISLIPPFLSQVVLQRGKMKWSIWI